MAEHPAVQVLMLCVAFPEGCEPLLMALSMPCLCLKFQSGTEEGPGE